MTNLSTNLLTSIVGAILAMIIVGGAVFESIVHGVIDSTLVVMATAVVATFFTGQAVRQVNGTKVDALAQSVAGLHARLDSAAIAPARDGLTGGTP
jgi:hypothetical protein